MYEPGTIREKCIETYLKALTGFLDLINSVQTADLTDDDFKIILKWSIDYHHCISFTKITTRLKEPNVSDITLAYWYNDYDGSNLPNQAIRKRTIAVISRMLSLELEKLTDILTSATSTAPCLARGIIPEPVPT